MRKGQATEPELMNYTLTRSFSHASHRTGLAPLSPIAPYVLKESFQSERRCSVYSCDV